MTYVYATVDVFYGDRDYLDVEFRAEESPGCASDGNPWDAGGLECVEVIHAETPMPFDFDDLSANDQERVTTALLS